jgi:hypothetical protein
MPRRETKSPGKSWGSLLITSIGQTFLGPKKKLKNFLEPIIFFRPNFTILKGVVNKNYGFSYRLNYLSGFFKHWVYYTQVLDP